MPSSETFYKCGEQHPHHRLTDAAVLFIRRSGLGLNELAARFSVCRSTIHRARIGRSWAHVPGGTKRALPDS